VFFLYYYCNLVVSYGLKLKLGLDKKITSRQKSSNYSYTASEIKSSSHKYSSSVQKTSFRDSKPDSNYSSASVNSDYNSNDISSYHSYSSSCVNSDIYPDSYNFFYTPPNFSQQFVYKFRYPDPVIKVSYYILNVFLTFMVLLFLFSLYMIPLC
jgi:hypothetical protein